MSGTFKKIYIDASALSADEFSAFYEKIDREAFMCSYDLKKIRCFIAYWPVSAGPLSQKVDVPDGVVLSELL